MKTTTTTFLAMLFAVASPLLATTLTLDPVRSQPGFIGMSMDPTTGTYYQRTGFNGETTVRTYASAAAFEAGIALGSVTLQSSGFYGTYFAVNSGKLFGRLTSNDAQTARWNAMTGAQEATSPSIPNMGGLNFNHTFDWGGFSGVNWLQDSTGLYVLGKESVGNTWQLDHVDANLNILSTRTFSDTSLGFAFMIDGNLFTSHQYSDSIVSNVFSFATGIRTAVNFQLNTVAGIYLSNSLYDPNSDTLYISNHASDVIYKLSDASQQLGVPESTSLELATMALVGLVTLRWHRRR